MSNRYAASTQSLFSRSYGPANAPVIVFLHGGGVSGWMWEPVMAQLPGYHCIALDLPESGGSAGIGPFSMALAAEKVAETIRQQAPGQRAHLVGLSEGAQVGVQLLATAPEVLQKALLSSPLLKPIPGTGWASSPALLAWTYRLSIPPFRNADWWIRLNMKYATGIPEAYFPQFKQSFQQTSESGFVNLMVANQRYRLPEGLARASAPTLVVVGSKEYSAMKDSARELAAALPQAKAAQVNLGPKASLASEHNWALSAPDLFAQTVRAWIEDGPLPQGVSEMG